MEMEFDWNKTKQPIIVDYEKSVNDDTYIFHTQAKKIDELLKSIPLKNDGLQSGEAMCINNTISIIGERGSGKSSLLGVAKHIAEKNEYCIFGPLDPAMFSSSLYLSEVFLGKMYEKITEYLNYETSAKLESLLIKHNNKIIQSLSTLNNIRLSKSKQVESFTTQEILEDYSLRVNFNKALGALTEDFIKIYDEVKGKKHKGLVVLIDDLDLVNHNEIYALTEEISRYFSNSVVLIVAYRESQLYNAVLSNMLQINTHLLQHGIIDTVELSNQATKYIEKLMPYSNHVVMSNEQQIYNMQPMSLLGNLQKKEDNIEHTQSKTVMEILDYNSYMKLGINLLPSDVKEKTVFSKPESLRGILEYFQLLDLMKNPTLQNNIEDSCDVIVDNISMYKDYLMNYSSSRLDLKSNRILKNWQNSTTESKNYILYLNIYNEFFRGKISDIGSMLDMSFMQPINVTLAHVHDLLEQLKLMVDHSVNINFLVYLIKVFYSLELQRLFVLSVKERSTQQEDYFIHEYLTLLNSYIVPQYPLDELTKQYGISWSFRYEGEEKDMLDLICYECVPSQGAIRMQLDFPNATQVQRAYFYRKLFSYEEIDFIKKRQYNYDLFAFLGRKNYIERAITTLLENNLEVRPFYVLTSFFDVDQLIRMNYTRRSEKNPVNYVMNLINKLLTGELRENKKITNLTPSIFTENISSKVTESNNFHPVYDEKLLTFDFNAFDIGLLRSNGEMSTEVDGANVIPPSDGSGKFVDSDNEEQRSDVKIRRRPKAT